MDKLSELLHFKNLLDSQEYEDDNIRHLKNGLIRNINNLIEQQERLNKPRKLVWTKTKGKYTADFECIAEDKDTNLYFEISEYKDERTWWLFSDRKDNDGRKYLQCNCGYSSLDDAQWVAEDIIEKATVSK